MIKISKIPVRRVKNLLFYSFLSFLLISIIHIHEYNIGISNLVLKNSENSTESIDKFLDSELNCIIHTYSNSISLNIEFTLIEDIVLSQNAIIQKKANLPKNLTYFQYKLRGPPINIV